MLHRNLLSNEVHVDKQFKILMRNSKSSAGTDAMEVEANKFAAELLLPEFLIGDVLAHSTFDIDDPAPLEELAKKFRVSKQMLNLPYPRLAQSSVISWHSLSPTFFYNYGQIALANGKWQLIGTIPRPTRNAGKRGEHVVRFYDTETTGINASFDQILQFAAIRTDADLNEIERFEVEAEYFPAC